MIKERLTIKERNYGGTGIAKGSLAYLASGGGIGLTELGSQVLTKLADYEDLEEQGLLIKLNNNDPDAVIEVLEEYLKKVQEQKEQNKIKVGDVVELTVEDVIGVVFDVDDDEICILDENGDAYFETVERVKKTNESLKDDIDVLLGKLRNISYLMEISE